MGAKRSVVLIAVTVVLSGCVRGWIYTDTVEPYCTDMRRTELPPKASSSGIKSVTIPRIPGARTEWDSNAIGDAAKAGGIEELHFCDRKLFSLIGGLWKRDTIVVYGK